MALVNSLTLKKEQRMSEQIAKEDIVRTNEFGQQVVVVPAGQPIPEEYVEKKAKRSAPENKAAK